jgi:hypothetical protein
VDICCAAVRSAAAFANSLSVDPVQYHAESDENTPDQGVKRKNTWKSRDVFLPKVTQKTIKHSTQRSRKAKFNAIIVEGAGGFPQIEALCDIKAGEEIFVFYSLEETALRQHCTHKIDNVSQNVFEQWVAGNKDLRVHMNPDVTTWNYGTGWSSAETPGLCL